jgi:hypothetical protein
MAGVGLVVALVAGLTGCGDDRPSIGLAEGSTVVLIGDSILYQSAEEVTDALEGAGLEPFIDAKPGAAIDGAPLINWHDALTLLVTAHHPDAVVVELGTNGCGYCPSMHEAVDAIMQAARDVPEVVWIDARSGGPVPEDPDAINDAIRGAGDRWDNLTVVDFDDLVDDDDISDDRIHLNGGGQVHFAIALADVLA